MLCCVLVLDIDTVRRWGGGGYAQDYMVRVLLVLT